jgi:hypothetical protein
MRASFMVNRHGNALINLSVAIHNLSSVLPYAFACLDRKPKDGSS